MRRAVAAWDHFWFAPQSTSTLAVVRITFALVLLAWAVALGPDLLSFLGSKGILPRAPDYTTAGQSGMWSLLGSAPGDAAVFVFYAIFVAAVICVLVGFHTRLAALAVFCGLVSLTRRNPFVLNSGDQLLRVTAFYLMLAPAGAALSVDRWREARRGSAGFWECPTRALWPLRLMQLQLSVLYLSTVWAKAAGVTWREGTAISYALRIRFLNRLPVPDLVTNSLLTSNVLSWATLATELALGILVWNRRLRPWVLLLGVGFHLAIDYALRVGFFSYAIFVLYVAFIPAETMDGWLLGLRQRLGRRRGRRPAEDVAPVRTAGEAGTQAGVG